MITCVLLTPLSWIKSLKWLALTSLFGVTALLFAVFATTADAAENSHNYSHQFKEIPLVKWDTYPLFLGNAAFLYLISTAILPLDQGMATKDSFSRPFTGAMVRAFH